MENSITANDGQTEVYTTEIFAIADEFVGRLEDAKETYDAFTWRALLREIYERLFQPENKMLYNCKTRLNLDDVQLLDSLWDCYTKLAYNYHHVPFLGGFGLMIGVSPTTLTNWATEATRNNTLSHFKAVKRWKAEAESTLEEVVTTKNSIGSIFILKSAFGWTESQPDTPQIEQITQSTPEQIRQRYADAKRPEIPKELFNDES